MVWQSEDFELQVACVHELVRWSKMILDHGKRDCTIDGSCTLWLLVRFRKTRTWEEDFGTEV